jgi:hypothetical protein
MALRSRLFFLDGTPPTKFGEKQVDRRVELPVLFLLSAGRRRGFPLGLRLRINQPS